MWDYLRFRYRRGTRKARRTGRILRLWSINYIDRHVWGKWHQLRLVRRFLSIWWAVIAVAFIGLMQQLGYLNSLATVSVPEPGGIYTEAAVGTVNTLNPLLPESTAASDINSLIFSGLTRYNARGQVVPDLATWTVSPDGETYTFHLRHGVKWQDGVPFTSADVAFTLTAIQDPDSHSPLASSWQGVQFATPDNFTVVFTLPQPLASFIDSTTVGIVPRHLLEDIDPTELRTATFNQHPIGTGPFELKTFAPAGGEIELAANPNYYFGRPKLDEFDFKFYPTAAAALIAYTQHQVTSPGQLLPSETTQAQAEPDLLQYKFSLPEEQVLFFNTKDPVLSDATLRLILSRSLNRQAVLNSATAGQATVVTQPLLPGQLGYTNQYQPPPFTRAQAAAALTAAGWTQAHPGATRTKNGRELSLQLVTLQNSELGAAATEIKRQWAPLGIKLSITTAGEDELQQTYMRPRNFQMLLYGLNVGADPDVYAYWHSSQATDPGVNLSQYASDTADHALESGRIATDPATRVAKYHTFLQAWDNDAPAAVLYQTGYVYATDASVAGIQAQHLITPSDRYYDIYRWTVRRRTVPAY